MTTQAPDSLDLDFVRDAFPGLADGFVYLDNAGGSLPVRPVIDRIADYLGTTAVQLGASYPASQLAASRLDDAVGTVATLLGARSDEVVMGPSTSALIGRLARACAPLLAPGDEIVITDTDHEANASPWRRFADRGIVVKTWRLDKATLRLRPEDLAALLTERTRLVAFPHVSNLLGSIEPVADIARLAHDHGALVCVDGVAHAPHRALDVSAWDVDFYAFSFYKVFGPHHAVLYGKRHLLEPLDNLNHDFFSRADVPYKLQPGSHCYELTYGCAGIADYLEALARHHGCDSGSSLREHIEYALALTTAHETRLCERLLAFLRDKPGVRILGETSADPRRRVSTVSFSVDGRDSADIPRAVDPHGIGIRYGDFYAPRLVDALGLTDRNGVVRVSMVHYNTLDEIDRLCAVLDRVL